jgi:hypothetical protein
VTSVRTVSTRRSAKQFARALGRDLDYLDAGIVQHGVERVRELSGAVAGEEPEPTNAVDELPHEVAGLLRRPRPVGMPGRAQDVQKAVTHLECEQDVKPPQRRRAVDVEEVDPGRVLGRTPTSGADRPLSTVADRALLTELTSSRSPRDRWLRRVGDSTHASARNAGAVNIRADRHRRGRPTSAAESVVMSSTRSVTRSYCPCS